VFISRSSLWSDLDCMDMDKTLDYLERSKPLPINVWLHRDEVRFSHRPFFKIVPHAIERLKSLSVDPGNLQQITPHLSCPAPLLEELSVRGYGGAPRRNPTLTSALFEGDLSTLRKLHLEYVITELPWRNMVNLTSLVLANLSQQPSVKRLLDFFESAPHLHEVELHSASPSYDAQDGRLVSLGSLKRMCIDGSGRPSLLLEHLLIPVGARLEVEVDLPSPPIGNSPPRFFDNLRNFPNFTTLRLLSGGTLHSRMEFSGPNGQVIIFPNVFRPNTPCLALGSLVQFDTSQTKRLEIRYGDHSASDSPQQTLLPMKDLRTLVLDRYARPDTFVDALDPSVSSSGVMVCPKLEELVIEDEKAVDIKRVIGMAEVRVSRGAKLKLVKIAGRDKFGRIDVLELEKHVSHVEC